MPGLDFTELLLVGIVALVFVGPERLPEMTRMLGRLYGQFRRSADELRRALTLEADRMDEEARLKGLIARRKKAEEERRRAAEARGDGARAQPDPAEAAVPEPANRAPAAGDPHAGGAADVAPGDASTGEMPPGFTAEQWEELPAHIKDIVRRRRSTP